VNPAPTHKVPRARSEENQADCPKHQRSLGGFAAAWSVLWMFPFSCRQYAARLGHCGLVGGGGAAAPANAIGAAIRDLPSRAGRSLASSLSDRHLQRGSLLLADHRASVAAV
jgi:hypothetical protein